jgi:hypothetical protein
MQRLHELSAIKPEIVGCAVPGAGESARRSVETFRVSNQRLSNLRARSMAPCVGRAAGDQGFNGILEVRGAVGILIGLDRHYRIEYDGTDAFGVIAKDG